ncbi:MAG: SsrA-binding protein SmpB [Elusimicrobia bacterium]|nr:SsrA-binding protein SmpB [Elusimicrobiota bacterium]
MAPPKKKEEPDKKVVASNRKARQFYEVLETFEAGLCLLGPEVKSLRSGKGQLDGCFGREDSGQLFLFNFYIPPYQFTTADPPDPRRTRKLLLHAREIDKIAGKLQTKGLALIPLEVYFRGGWAKVLLALARGKKGPDRRDDLKKKDQAREAEKSFKGKYRG